MIDLRQCVFPMIDQDENLKNINKAKRFVKIFLHRVEILSPVFEKYSLEHHIHFIRKQINPLKIPKAGPIESYWAMTADKVYDGSWQPMRNIN